MARIGSLLGRIYRLPATIAGGWAIAIWMVVAASAHAGTTNVTTGLPTDISIAGSGYFIVRDPVSGLYAATRFGSFTTDANGYLITAAGSRLQGFFKPAQTIIGDLQIDAAGFQDTNGQPVSMISFTIQTNGNIVVGLTDGTARVRCQIFVQLFSNPAALVKAGDRLFAWGYAAGPSPRPVAPGTSGGGWLVTGTLEQLVPQLQLTRYTHAPATSAQGILAPTGVPTELGIEGTGFFVLRRTNDNTRFATRAGAFYVDGSGYLTHYSGLRLQGYVDTTRTTIGDVQVDTLGIPASNHPAAPIVYFSIDSTGDITEGAADGTTFVRGQLVLQACAQPDLLVRAAYDLYPIDTNTASWSAPGQPLTQSLGWLVVGALEGGHLDTNLLSVRSHLNFFPQGEIESTGVASDLAISGAGFFTLRDSATGSACATRLGAFSVDANGYLVTADGMRVQGLADPALTQTGDILISTSGTSADGVTLVGYTVDACGVVILNLADGTQLTRAQILVQQFRNLQGLTPVGGNLYSNLTAAQPLFTNGLAGYFLTGTIQSAALELPPAPPAALQLPAIGDMRLYVSDLPAGTAQIQSSTDLRHWQSAGQVNGAALNEAEFFDPPRPGQKFYRVVVRY